MRTSEEKQQQCFACVIKEDNVVKSQKVIFRKSQKLLIERAPRRQSIQNSQSGADPGFLNRGGAKMCSAHTSAKHGVPLIRPGSIGPELKGTGSSEVLDALSCYLRLILKHSDTKLNKKNIVDHILEGARPCCAPLWIRHWSISIHSISIGGFM